MPLLVAHDGRTSSLPRDEHAHAVQQNPRGRLLHATLVSATISWRYLVGKSGDLFSLGAFLPRSVLYYKHTYAHADTIALTHALHASTCIPSQARARARTHTHCIHRPSSSSGFLRPCKICCTHCCSHAPQSGSRLKVPWINPGPNDISSHLTPQLVFL